jgi:hypothetical protein
MTLTPLLTLTLPPSERQFPHSPKIEYFDAFCCRLGYRHRTEFLKTDSESLFPDGSEHVCLAPS